MKKSVKIQAWKEAIANRADVEISVVEQVLAEYRIEASPVLQTPKTLVLKEIRFVGVKDERHNHAKIDFAWGDLDAGIYACLTEKNLRGKSSILEVVRWLLRGCEPSNLQTDVRSWLTEASLKFELDDVLFEIEVKCTEGVHGKLSRYSKGGKKRRVNGFQSDDEFGSVMASFFMHEFRMDSVAVHRKVGEFGGKTVLHGWQALSSAMFIGTDYTTLVGEIPPATGLPFRMMQMYLGVPWVSTLAATKAAQSEMTRKVAASDQVLKNAKQETQNRIEVLESELMAKQKQLSKLPDVDTTTDKIKSLRHQHENLVEELRQLSLQAKATLATLEKAEQMFADDRREYQLFVDGNAADFVFRSLDPSCCPRCDHAIPDARKQQEHESNECAVCGEQVHADVPTAEIQKQLKDRMAASKKARTVARKSSKELVAQRTELEHSIEACEADIASESRKLSKPSNRGNLKTEIAILEARIDEASANLPKDSPENMDLLVLNAVADETEKLVKEVQAEVLTKVSEGIVQYANRFGMTSLTSATLRGNMTLLLERGESTTSYSKVTAGEQLRLKVAAILSMLKVGEELGVGRYPGLLLVDSPAAQEIALEDLEQLIGGLVDLADEIKHLQVFVASVASKAIRSRVDESRVRQALGDDYLW